MPEAQLECLVPILFSGFETTLRFHTEKLGFAKEWAWGDPPSFESVSRDGIEIFLCYARDDGQGSGRARDPLRPIDRRRVRRLKPQSPSE